MAVVVVVEFSVQLNEGEGLLKTVKCSVVELGVGAAMTTCCTWSVFLRSSLTWRSGGGGSVGVWGRRRKEG